MNASTAAGSTSCCCIVMPPTIPARKPGLHADLHGRTVQFYVEDGGSAQEGGGVERICGACGEVTSATARFCAGCGAALDADRCACGEVLPAGARFCPACGASTARSRRAGADCPPSAGRSPSSSPTPSDRRRSPSARATRRPTSSSRSAWRSMTESVERHGGTDHPVPRRRRHGAVRRASCARGARRCTP